MDVFRGWEVRWIMSWGEGTWCIQVLFFFWLQFKVQYITCCSSVIHGLTTIIFALKLQAAWWKSKKSALKLTLMWWMRWFIPSWWDGLRNKYPSKWCLYFWRIHPTKYAFLNLPEDAGSQSVTDQAAWSSCGVPLQGTWTRWPSDVPSNSRNCKILHSCVPILVIFLTESP